MFSLESMLTKTIILSGISKREAVTRAFEYCGSKGNLLISMPSSVISPFSFRAYSKKSSLNALKIASLSGFSMYSKLITS